MVRTFVGLGLAGLVALSVAGTLSAAHRPAKSSPILRQLSLEESAPVVPLFDGVDAGQLQVRMTALSPHKAHVFVKNLTDEPLTVALPKAAVGVHILPQFQNPGNGFGNQFGNPFGNNNPNLFGNQFGNQNQAGNDQNRGQSIGGLFQPFNGNQQNFFNNQGNNNGLNNFNAQGNFNGQGLGFFSIPPEKTVQLKMRTVCLNQGAPDPNAGMKYELRRLEAEVTNPALQELLERYTVRVDPDAMQAAAWHLSNGLSWNQLSNLAGNDLIRAAGGRMFDAQTVKQAQSLVEQAEAAAKDRPQTPPKAVAPRSQLTTQR
jgi:hypothetical protein